MASREENDRGLRSSPQGNLESPFLEEELFAGESEAEWEAHLAALEAESPFQRAFEHGRRIQIEPEELEEEPVEEDESPDVDDFPVDEAEAQDEEALGDLEDSVEELYDEEEAPYAEGEEEAFPEDDTSLEEGSVIPEEVWIEPEDEEGAYPLEGAADAEEELSLDEEFSIEPEEEEVDWANFESEQGPDIPAGREELTRLPLLRHHRGAGPDLILSWNAIAGPPQSVDVVVHLHGYSLRAGKLLDLSRDIVPRSGLDWSDPEGLDRGPGRSRPTLALLPRGHFFGGKSGRGYSFPALVTQAGLQQLIDFGLGHFAKHIGATNLALGRLIITAHSGGGAALLRILRHNDPHEVHVFDGLYQDPAELVRWAKARIERDGKAFEAGGDSAEHYMLERGGALRVLFRPGSATQRHSLPLHRALVAAIPPGSALRRRYRVEQTSVGHLLIPRRYGWRLLADTSADLPLTSSPAASAQRESYLEEGAAYGDVEREVSQQIEVVFPSGESLRVLSGIPEGKQQDYWDPTGSGNPLLDTGPAHKDKKLSANFTVRQLTMSGGVSADIARIDPKLVASLQRLRDYVGKDVKITSGYRSWKRNKQVYAGRKNPDGTPKKPTLSQHCGGRAADINVIGMNGLEIGKATIHACGPNIGVGLGNTFAHIDVRGFAEAWNYGGVKDSWVAEIKRYQQAKGGMRPMPTGGMAKPKPNQQSATKPPVELVRFAQRVLNAAEGERLAVDGDLGPLTRGALERFRKRYSLGSGSVLDTKTELALAQRALEEIAQQSLVAQLGVHDAKTEQALITFKSERGLGLAPTLDEKTRVALTDALARRASPTERPRLASLVLLLDRIRATPKTYIQPRTRRAVVDGYERAEPRGDVWCQQAGLSLDEGALARVVASEVGTMAPQYMLAVAEATRNEARAKRISVFQRVTMQGLKLKGGVTPKSAGYFGRQSGRWSASIQDPTLQHLEAVRIALAASEPLVARDGRRWVDGQVMDGGLQAGKKLKYNAMTIVEKWGAEGWEWIGPIYEPDGKTLLLDPYRLMVLRFAGRGKADIRRGVEAIRDGRRRWNVKAG